MGAGASSAIRDQILMGGRLETLAHRCESLYEDDEFDCLGMSAELLGNRFTSQLLRYPDEEIHWLRPSFFGKGTLYCDGHEGFDYSNILGAVDGCTRDLTPVLQALCMTRPDYLKTVFVSYNATVGCCVIRLFQNGQFHLIVIDDRIPCRRIRKTHPAAPEYEPISAHTCTGDAWLPLLEKALAKLNGSYSATALGDGARDLFKDICGGEHVIDIKLGKSNSEESFKLFTALHHRFANNGLVITARKSSVSTRTWAAPQRMSAVLNFSSAVNEEVLKDSRGESSLTRIDTNAPDTSFRTVPKDLIEEDLRRKRAWQYICLAADDKLEDIVDEEEEFIAEDLKRKIEEAKVEHPYVDDGRAGLFGMVKAVDAGEAKGELSAAEASEAEQEGDLLPKFEWLRWSQFCEDYERLTVCIVSSDGHMCTQSPSVHADALCTITGKWDSQLGTAGGGHHLKTWRNSPLFRIRMLTNVKCKGKLLVTVSLPDSRRRGELMGADSDDWNGDQDRGGKLLYPAHALYVCKDEPCLENILVSTDYRQQRDATVELSVNTVENGPFSYILVPCTEEDNVDHAFHITVTLLTTEGKRVMMAVNTVQSFTGFNYSAKVHGRWTKGESAMGLVSGHNEWSALNPCWRMHILGASTGGGVAGESTVSDSRRSVGSVLGDDPDVTRAEDDDLRVPFEEAEPSLDQLDGPGVGAAPSVILEGVEASGSALSKGQGQGHGQAQTGGLSYEDLNDPGVQASVSVASNDTGPYSPVRLAKKEDKPTVRHFQICSLLSPNATSEFGQDGSRPDSPSPTGIPGLKERYNSEYLRSGTYLLTPNAFATLLHRKGKCGTLHVNDGFLGKFRHECYPVTTRKEAFCVFSGGSRGRQFLHRGSDVYEDIFVMPTLHDKGAEGSFQLEVMSNLPFELEPVDLSRVPHPLKDLQSLNATRSAALHAFNFRKAPKIDGFTPAQTPVYGVGDTQTSFSRGIVTSTIKQTSVEEEDLENMTQEDKPEPTLEELYFRDGKDAHDEEKNDPNQSVRQSLVVIKKSIATQIREDTDKRVMAITLKQMANEDQLEREIKRQYEEARAAEEALVNSTLAGGAHHFD
jgi:hypothetical protein